jgi:hypothetical protein
MRRAGAAGALPDGAARFAEGAVRLNNPRSLPRRSAMSSALYPAFFFTVALLVTTAYFLLGGLPLLVLKHDVPLDARFIRGFFNVYYRAAFWTALGACASYALWGRFAFAAGAAGLAVVAMLLRSRLLSVMHQLGVAIEANEDAAIERFRRVHVAALLVNVAQLVVLVWGLLQLSQPA